MPFMIGTGFSCLLELSGENRGNGQIHRVRDGPEDFELIQAQPIIMRDTRDACRQEFPFQHRGRTGKFSKAAVKSLECAFLFFIYRDLPVDR